MSQKASVALGLVAIVLLFVGAWFFTRQSSEPVTTQSQLQKTSNNQTMPQTNLSKLTVDQKLHLSPPSTQIDPKKTYLATLKTSAGDIVIKLHASETPITVTNFVYLARQGFYDDTIFHRAIKGFMIQGGDPLGTGMGGPGYKFNDEKFTGEYKRGIVAMANAGPNTNGSQFFIMHQDYPLPPNYVIFGEVVSGLDVVDKIATAPVTQSSSGEASKPINPVSVNTMTIEEK